MGRSFIICLSLIVATAAIYSQAIHFDFVTYDDDIYVTENTQVRNGLTAAGVAWVFTSEHGGNWHPVTGLSHMLDCELFQLNPAGHHLTSVLIHILNTLLLFGVLRSMTRAVWRSALVAALFALHPLHVESVAWVSERKDVLSTFFGLLSIWAYVAYTRRPGLRRYLLTVILMAMGLMAKPMLVTLPLLLLLLDYWPLGRMRIRQSLDSNIVEGSAGSSASILSQRSIGFLLIEKMPLLALSAASCVITLIVQRSAGAVGAIDVIPIKLRIANALVSYVRYLGKMFWPTNLSVLYPHPNLPGGTPWTVLQVVGSGLLLFAITVLIIRAIQHRYALVGWLWYLGSLIPVIGLVQVGSQAIADRYTYLPLIGPFVMVAWAGDGLMATLRCPNRLIRPAAALAAALVLSAAMASSWLQVGHWRHSIALFNQALEATSGSPDIHYNLATALQAQQKVDAAIDNYELVLELDPFYAEAHNNLGLLLELQGKVDDAIRHYRQAIELKPQDARPHLNLGITLLRTEQVHDARLLFEKAASLDPKWPDPLNQLAWLLATHSDSRVRNPKRALDLAQQADALTSHQDAAILDTLAAAQAATNQFDQAVKIAQEALTLAEQSQNVLLAQQIRDRLSLYRKGIPYRAGDASE